MKGVSLLLLTQLFVCVNLVTSLAEEGNGPKGRDEPRPLNLTDEKSHLDRGIASVKKNDWSEAINEFSRVISVNSNSVEAYEYRGCAQLMTGNVDTAIDDFSRAIKIEPTNSRVYLDRANAYRLKNEFNQAIQDLNSSVRLNPTNDVAYKTRAACYSQVHNYKDAIQDWSEGLRLRREDAIALACRGGDYFMDSQFDKALADVYAAIRMDSTNCLAYDWLAWLRATCPIDSMRNGKEAVEAATKACEMSNWKNTDWIDTLAAAYAETGDFEEAVKYEKQALAGESLSVSARNEWQHRLSMYEQKKPNHNGQKE